MTKPPQLKTATPWDAVCAANEYLDAAGINLSIHAVYPDIYQVCTYEERESTSEPGEVARWFKGVGRYMTEAEMLAFVRSPMFQPD